jgi:hypothetical protein
MYMLVLVYIKKSVNKISKYFKSRDGLNDIKKYYRNNFKFTQNSKKVVLIEAYLVPSTEIAILQFLKVLSEKIEFTPVLFYSLDHNFFQRLRLRLEFRFTPIYAAGIRKIIYINTNTKMKSYVKKKACTAIAEIKTLKDFEDLSIYGLPIGSIFYDHFLRKFDYHTILLADHKLELKILLEKFIYIFEKFSMLISKYEVKSILVSHCTYWHAIPAKLGIDNDINVFQVTGESVYRITKERPFAYTDFFDYRSKFSELSDAEKIGGLNLAKERLEQRFKGAIAVDMPDSTASAFASKYDPNIKILKQTPKKKLLVAVHDFYDSPHPFGWNLHADIYEWLCELKYISNFVDYEWYLKTHPDIRGNGKEVLEEFVIGTDKFFIIDPDTSHHQLIDEGIDCVLTVFGTIATEYPYFGIPVISASKNNPHAAYNFSITPKSIEQYRQILFNLENLPKTIDKDEILEYYYMHNIYPIKSLLFNDYEKYLEEIGGYEESMSDKVYSVYLHSKNARNIVELYRALSDFINSNSQRLDPAHFKK